MRRLCIHTKSLLFISLPVALNKKRDQILTSKIGRGQFQSIETHNFSFDKLHLNNVLLFGYGHGDLKVACSHCVLRDSIKSSLYRFARSSRFF